MPRSLKAYVYLALAMMLVGSTVVASKIIAVGLPPFTATALRFAMALPVFLLLMRIQGTRLPSLRRSEWGLLCLQAVAGSVGYTVLLISGVARSSAADAGVIIGTLPVVAALVAIVVLGERPKLSTLVAIALAASGVLVIALRSDEAAGQSILGAALVFAAVICESLFILLNKRIKTHIAPLALSGLMAGIGFIVAGVASIAEAPWTIPWHRDAFIAVAYYALVPTVGGFILWYAGTAQVSAAEASLFTALAPVSAVLMAGVFLGEAVSVTQVVGIICVLLAVLLLSAFRPVGQ